MSLVLGLDASTQSFSALVIDTQQGHIVADCSINFGQALPHYNAPSGFTPNGPADEVHADPLMWLDALEILLKTLAQTCDLSQITAISGAGQQHGSVYLNEQWTATLPSLQTQQSLASQIAPCLSRSTAPIWIDTSTQAECTEIAQAVGGNTVVCSKSGSIAIERFTGPQIRRFYKSQLQAYHQTQRIHLVSSFLCSVLCGQDAPIDIGDGAGMNLLNIKNWKWDPYCSQQRHRNFAKNSHLWFQAIISRVQSVATLLRNSDLNGGQRSASSPATIQAVSSAWAQASPARSSSLLAPPTPSLPLCPQSPRIPQAVATYLAIHSVDPCHYNVLATARWLAKPLKTASIMIGSNSQQLYPRPVRAMGKT